MPRIDKRFTVLFTEEEILLLKKHAKIRGVSSGELIRIAVQNEIYGKSFFDRINALKRLYTLGQNLAPFPDSEDCFPTGRES